MKCFLEYLVTIVKRTSEFLPKINVSFLDIFEKIYLNITTFIFEYMSQFIFEAVYNGTFGRFFKNATLLLMRLLQFQKTCGPLAIYYHLGFFM